MHTISRVIRLFGLLLFLMPSTSCFFVPESYDAAIEINRNRTYRLSYSGYLTHVYAKMEEVEKGKLSADSEEALRKAEQGLRAEPGFKEVSYLGHGRYRVRYERSGRLNGAVHFLADQNRILSVIPLNDRSVEIMGFEMEKNDAEELKRLGLKGDGALKVKTDGKVVRHNAMSEPWVFGLVGAYEWRFKSYKDPAPIMVIQLN